MNNTFNSTDVLSMLGFNIVYIEVKSYKQSSLRDFWELTCNIWIEYNTDNNISTLDAKILKKFILVT